jgi:peptide chain release factor 1
MTNTVSLYIAAGSGLQHARNLAKRELAGSRSVKSDWTRTEVEAAWQQILVYLNGLREVPPKGLIIFASSGEFEVVEPPVPNRSNIYRCGSAFFREPLERMYDESAGEKTGLILIDNNEATLAWFRGETIVALWHDFSGIMGKHQMGGQSSARFQRGHEEQRKQWWRKIADVAKQSLLPLDITKLLVAGPGFIKRDMLNDGVLDYRFVVIAVVDAEYVDDVAGPREALARWKLAQNAEQ